jgi:hypothetical protein
MASFDKGFVFLFFFGCVAALAGMILWGGLMQ